MNAENGFGSPAISYFPILHYYLSLPFYPLIKYGENIPLYASATLSIILSGIFMYKYLSLKTSSKIASLAAVFYMIFPYHLGVNYYYRFAFSELWALTFFPLALFYIEKNRVVSASLSVAALCLCHLLLAPFLCGILFALILIKRNYRMIWALIYGISVSAFHNYPAVLNSGLISAQLGVGIYDYSDNFIDFKSTKGILFSVTALITIIFISRRSYLWSGLLAVSLFMCFEYSKFIWELITPLNNLSFPWRFLMLAGISSAILAAYSERKILFGVIFLSILINYPFIQFHNSENPNKYLKQNILTIDDFRPETVPQKLVVSRGSKTAPKIQHNFRNISVQKLNNIIVVSSKKPGTAVLPIFYFPNWNSVTPLSPDSNGLIKLNLPRDKQVIIYYSTDQNMALGRWITIISLIALLVIAIRTNYENRRKNRN
jgi:hypothetical protein